MGSLSVGTKCRIVRGEGKILSGEEDLIGQVGCITRIEVIRGEVRFHLDLPPHNGYPVAPIRNHLIPLYDGDEPASWETCAWRPKEIVLAPSLKEAFNGQN